MNSKFIDEYLAKCWQQMQDSKSISELYQTIVNTPFAFPFQTTLLGLGIVVLLLKNDATQTIDRVALSQTERAQGAINYSVKEFRDILIPLDATDNVLVQVIQKHEPRIVTDWKYLFIPALSAQEARLNQAGAAVDCSVIYPVFAADDTTVIGALIYSYFEPMSKLTNYHQRFMQGYSQLTSEVLHGFSQ